MDISIESRHELKAAVTRALQKLRDEFRLQARIEGAQPTLQAAYAGILGHWVREAAPPDAGIAPRVVLDELAAIDAVVIDENGIGCYPFSARKTGIRVHYSDTSVYSMCAIDALAIPRLVRHPSCVTARCAVCQCHLACDLEANGALPHDFDRGIRVLWNPPMAPMGPCCDSLCVGIAFICRHCSVPEGPTGFSLPEAAAIGNAFFGFQHRLLNHCKRL